MARSEEAPAQRRLDPETARRVFSARLLGEVASELRRVTWPTREETFRLTVMVIMVSVVIGVFLGLIDIGFSELIERIIR